MCVSVCLTNIKLLTQSQMSGSSLGLSQCASPQTDLELDYSCLAQRLKTVANCSPIDKREMICLPTSANLSVKPLLQAVLLQALPSVRSAALY